jgi:hypothetical protein
LGSIRIAGGDPIDRVNPVSSRLRCGGIGSGRALVNALIRKVFFDFAGASDYL